LASLTGRNLERAGTFGIGTDFFDSVLDNMGYFTRFAKQEEKP